MAEKVLPQFMIEAIRQSTNPPMQWTVEELCDSHEHLRSQLASVEAEREQFRKDAERWKWVEANTGDVHEFLECVADMPLEQYVDQQLQEPTK